MSEEAFLTHMLDQMAVSWRRGGETVIARAAFARGYSNNAIVLEMLICHFDWGIGAHIPY